MNEDNRDVAVDSGSEAVRLDSAGTRAAPKLTPDPPLPIDSQLDQPYLRDAKNVVRQMADQLARRGNPRSYSLAALDVLWETQADYIRVIAAEAVRAARGGDDEYVQAKHVRHATRIFASGRTPLSKALEPIGGVLAGAGLSQAITTVLVPGTRTTGSLVLMLLLVISGVTVLAFSLSRSWRR